MVYRSTDDVVSQGCPPALKCLVFVWDALNKDFQTFANTIIADKENKETSLPKISKNDEQMIDYQKSKLKSKKLIDEGNTPLGAVGGSSDISVWCDLCNTDISPGTHHSPYQQNAFTQHLKKSHPGCGESANGKGYNSNGVYCEGWAGQCGEEGVGATSWYLLCELCREKYMLPNKKALNVNDSLLARAAFQEQKLPPPLSTFNKKSKLGFNMNMDFFDTMKENALFLLDLNSHNGGLLNKTAGNHLMSLKQKFNVRHSNVGDYVQPNTSNFSQRPSANILDDNTKKSLQKQNSMTNYYGKKNTTISGYPAAPELLWTPPESISCLEMLNAKISESDSGNNFNLDCDKKNYDPMLIEQHQQNQNQIANNENKFHRSFSMIQGWGFYSLNPSDEISSNQESVNSYQILNENKVVMRRKKTCLCDSSKHTF